jgi:hypothetical protein
MKKKRYRALDSLSEDQGSLFQEVGLIDPKVISYRNKRKDWAYGYNKEYDMVVISRDGTIGSIYNIQGLNVAVPAVPDNVYKRSVTKREQYWQPFEHPPELARVKNIAMWHNAPKEFKSKWVGYIEEEFDRREYGFWFMNNGEPTYITGSNYMYLQWTKIDVGLPDYREANRIFWLFWEACKADDRSFGMVYVKIRRSGFSFMASSESVNIGTITKKSRIGIVSKSGHDAKTMFTNKVVPISSNYPFFFKPIQDGMDKPKTELAYRIPASKITKKNMLEDLSGDVEGLDSSIDWRNTADNSYDGEKLKLLVEDEAGKLEAPNNVLNGWRVRKTCLRVGMNVIGKCMMGSTVNALNKGGQNFKDLYYDSDVNERNANGQTKSGLYALFIPMEWNMEGFIDRYGMPVIETPDSPVLGIDGKEIEMGAVEYWNNEVDSLKSNPSALNEHYRQYPRTISHAFRDESKSSIFNLTKIYQQIEYNDSLIKERVLTRGSFHWKDGVKFGNVVWTPDIRGRFLVSWIPPTNMQNRYILKNGMKSPGNEHLGVFGCDPYDISATVFGRGSNGSLHGMTKFHMDDAPVNEFFLEYISRPQTAEIFFEDVLMACVFYGMPVLIENNKQRLLYFFKNNGYRNYSMNRPDRHMSKLSKTEKELGGIPNSSEDVKQAHATAIETYIEKHVGYDSEGTYRDPEEMGTMYFNRTLEDWAKFDINDRTKFDAAISSGLAIMANQKHLYTPVKKESKISIKFARYNNEGSQSRIIR